MDDKETRMWKEAVVP